MTLKGFIPMLIAGLIGAAIWAALAYFSGYEAGIIAWGIGLLVGGAAMSSVGDSANASTGILAVLITIISITLGKAMVVEIYVQEMLAEMQTEDIDEQIKRLDNDNDFLITFIAQDVVFEHEIRGDEIKWPNDKEPEYDEYDSPDVYPDDIWFEAEDVWNAMTVDEQSEFRVDMQEQLRAQHELGLAFAGIGGRIGGFLYSFGLLDILFYFLAMGSAYKMGSGGYSE